MKRLISPVVAALALAFPAAASADIYYEREDGTRFDSDVGAACGALHTDILFDPNELTLEIHDEGPLDYLAECMRSGALATAVIGIVAPYDGSEWGTHEAHTRQLAVRAYLMERGVNPNQLTTWRTVAPVEPWAPGRVQFRIVEEGEAALLDTRLVYRP